MVLNGSGHISYTNSEKSLGSNWIECLDPADQPSARQKISHTLATREATTLEFRRTGSTPEMPWFQARFSALPAPLNTEVALVVHDITENKRAEEALQESEERFSNAFKYAAIGMALVSTEGKWLKVNRSVCDLLGYSESELSSKTFQDITHPDDLDADLMHVRRMLAGEIRTYEMLKRYFHKSGHIIWARLSVSLVRNQKREPLYFISQIENITERKRAEEKLIQSAKLASLGEMSAGIAHEISNPLTIISGSVNLLHKAVKDPEKFTAKINAIQKATARITKIVNGLRKYSRVSEENQFSKYCLSEIVRESILLTQGKSKRNDVSVTYDLTTESLIYCDDVAIEQVIINLIDNALDAVKGRDQRWVKIETFTEAHSVGLRVSDSGTGIPEAIQNKLFDPFFTTKPVGEGTGLGLSITKGILEEHSATITVLTNHQNTCFEVRFQK